MRSHATNRAVAGNQAVVPTTTYATFNPTYTHADLTLSNGNRTVAMNTAAHRMSLFTIEKTVGIHSFEVSNTSGTDFALPSPFYLYLAGVAPDRTLTNYIGQLSGGAGNQSGIGSLLEDGVTTNNYFDSISTVDTLTLIVIDFDTRKIGSIESGVIKWSGVIDGAGPMYMGISHFNNTSTIASSTINTGQEPFTAPHKAILAGISGAIEGVF